MSNFVDTWFDTSRYMPHGYCLLWQPELVWMHVLSDIVIALAYFSIPLTIVVLLYKRKQTLPLRWVYVMFAAFILLCGATHLLRLITLWHPIYYFEGMVKVLTGAVSMATALLLIPLLPQLLDLFKDESDSKSKSDSSKSGS